MSIKYSEWDYDGYDLIDNLPTEKINCDISPAEYRWIETKGYMITGIGAEIFGFKHGIMCMNCYSMVYYDKCPNDQCYNFYHYINAKHCSFMKDMKWQRLDELGITKERD
jgi:hypothetical protein